MARSSISGLIAEVAFCCSLAEYCGLGGCCAWKMWLRGDVVLGNGSTRHISQDGVRNRGDGSAGEPAVCNNCAGFVEGKLGLNELASEFTWFNLNRLGALSNFDSLAVDLAFEHHFQGAKAVAIFRAMRKDNEVRRQCNGKLAGRSQREMDAS